MGAERRDCLGWLLELTSRPHAVEHPTFLRVYLAWFAISLTAEYNSFVLRACRLIFYKKIHNGVSG